MMCAQKGGCQIEWYIIVKKCPNIVCVSQCKQSGAYLSNILNSISDM